MGGVLGNLLFWSVSGRIELYRQVNKERRGILELEKRQRSPLSSDFYRDQRFKIRKSEDNSDRKSKIFWSVTS